MSNYLNPEESKAFIWQVDVKKLFYLISVVLYINVIIHYWLVSAAFSVRTHRNSYSFAVSLIVALSLLKVGAELADEKPLLVSD